MNSGFLAGHMATQNPHCSRVRLCEYVCKGSTDTILRSVLKSRRHTPFLPLSPVCMECECYGWNSNSHVG